MFEHNFNLNAFAQIMKKIGFEIIIAIETLILKSLKNGPSWLTDITQAGFFFASIIFRSMAITIAYALDCMLYQYSYEYEFILTKM